ncbi:hypothetical protein [Leptospira noguchii]|uniref:hypothetical protein n=1 Tax=Leptospira noguchii TaxID=28182 RepID=UPI001FB5ED92|nr:hypothetical protein [Leptospira noguchii]UOG32319.1 hypothetical protein MAL06_12085 [Leptospira noguchii]
METQHNAFLWVALWGGNSVLQKICRNSDRFNIEIQILVGLVMALYGSSSQLANFIVKMAHDLKRFRKKRFAELPLS